MARDLQAFLVFSKHPLGVYCAGKILKSMVVCLSISTFLCSGLLVVFYLFTTYLKLNRRTVQRPEGPQSGAPYLSCIHRNRTTMHLIFHGHCV